MVGTVRCAGRCPALPRLPPDSFRPPLQTERGNFNPGHLWSSLVISGHLPGRPCRQPGGFRRRGKEEVLSKPCSSRGNEAQTEDNMETPHVGCQGFERARIKKHCGRDLMERLENSARSWTAVARREPRHRFWAGGTTLDWRWCPGARKRRGAALPAAVHDAVPPLDESRPLLNGHRFIGNALKVAKRFVPTRKHTCFDSPPPQLRGSRNSRVTLGSLVIPMSVASIDASKITVLLDCAIRIPANGSVRRCLPWII